MSQLGLVMDVQTENRTIALDMGCALTSLSLAFAFSTALIPSDGHSTRCREHSSEIPVNMYYTVSAHTSTQHPRCQSSCPSRCAGCVALRSGDVIAVGVRSEACREGISCSNPITSVIVVKIKEGERIFSGENLFVLRSRSMTAKEVQ